MCIQNDECNLSKVSLLHALKSEIVYCVLCIVYCVLCIVYCVLCIVYCVLCIVYCVLCIVYCEMYCFVDKDHKH